MSTARTRVGRTRTSGGSRTNKKTGVEPDNDPEDSLCIICTEKIVFAAVSPCHHTTCHYCGLRQRALYGRKLCLVCRTDNENNIFTDQIEKSYESFNKSDIYETNTDYGISFTSVTVQNDTLGLLEFKCPLDKSHESMKSFKDLADHVKTEHNKFYCMICSKNKKAFASELPLYTHKQLQRHQTEGDSKGFDGHPECKYCRGNRFYSEDELNVHIRDKHERCYICDQHDAKNASYYKNYDSLYEHFRQAHYVCSVPSCIEKRFVVFREDLDLTAHMLKEHGGLTNGSRFVIGATGPHFQSHLSTYTPATSERHNDSNQHENHDLKKKRLDERVKHYVNYDTSKMQEFKRLCADYRSLKVTAQQLQETFKELFKLQQKNEVGLILYELAELFPKGSDKHKALMVVYDVQVTHNKEDQFPVLSGLKNAFTGSIHGWNTLQNSAASSQESFPVLPKPKKKNASGSAAQPIRYTTLKKPTKVTTVILSSPSTVNKNFKPTYLDNRRTASSTALASENKEPLTRHSSSSLNLADPRFPALEKKTTKKVFPRVNPAPATNSSSWCPALNSKSPEPLDNSGIEILDKRKVKLKKKQEKILFTNNH